MIVSIVNSYVRPLLLAALSLTPILAGCSGETESKPKTLTAEEKLDGAIARCDLNTVKNLVPSAVAVDAEVGTGAHPPGDTPLALALWEANKFPPANPNAFEIIKYLIACGADVNLPNRDGRTPLHFPHNKQVVRLLVDSGANVDVKATADGTTPLYRTDDIGLLQILVPASKDINSLDSNGMTALDYHMQWAYAREDIIALLRKHGAKTAGERNASERKRP